MRPVCDFCRLGFDGEPIIVGYTTYRIRGFHRTESGVFIDREPILVKAHLCSNQCRDEFIQKQAELDRQRRELAAS
jgi:hypothetical protein